MNRSYKVIFNISRGLFAVVSEITQSLKKMKVTKKGARVNSMRKGVPTVAMSFVALLGTGNAFAAFEAVSYDTETSTYINKLVEVKNAQNGVVCPETLSITYIDTQELEYSNDYPMLRLTTPGTFTVNGNLDISYQRSLTSLLGTSNNLGIVGIRVDSNQSVVLKGSTNTISVTSELTNYADGPQFCPYGLKLESGSHFDASGTSLQITATVEGQHSQQSGIRIENDLKDTAVYNFGNLTVTSSTKAKASGGANLISQGIALERGNAQLNVGGLLKASATSENLNVSEAAPSASALLVNENTVLTVKAKNVLLESNSLGGKNQNSFAVTVRKGATLTMTASGDSPTDGLIQVNAKATNDQPDCFYLQESATLNVTGREIQLHATGGLTEVQSYVTGVSLSDGAMQFNATEGFEIVATNSKGQSRGIVGGNQDPNHPSQMQVKAEDILVDVDGVGDFSTGVEVNGCTVISLEAKAKTSDDTEHGNLEVLVDNTASNATGFSMRNQNTGLLGQFTAKARDIGISVHGRRQSIGVSVSGNTSLNLEASNSFTVVANDLSGSSQGLIGSSDGSGGTSQLVVKATDILFDVDGAKDYSVGVAISGSTDILLEAKSSTSNDTEHGNLNIFVDNATSRATGFSVNNRESQTVATFTAKAQNIEIVARGKATSQGVLVGANSSLVLEANESLSISVEGVKNSYGEVQFGVQAQNVNNNLSASTISLQGKEVLVDSSIDATGMQPQAGQKDSSGASGVQINKTSNGSQHQVNIGTKGAELVQITANAKGATCAYGLNGNGGELVIGSEDSVVKIEVTATDNANASDYTYEDNGINTTYKARGIQFNGTGATMTINGSLLDVAIDGDSIRTAGMRIAQGGELNVNAPMLMTVSSSFESLTQSAEGQTVVNTKAGQRNEGIILHNDNTQATFAEPVTMVTLNDKGQAVSAYLKDGSTLTFESNTVLMAGNDRSASVMQAIEAKRAGDTSIQIEPGYVDEQYLTEEAFSRGTKSYGIMSGVGSVLNFNGGTNTIIANTMFAKINSKATSGGTINVASGAKLTLTADDIGWGTVNVSDGGVLNTTTRQMNILAGAALVSSGTVAAENFTIAGGSVLENDGLMTVKTLAVTSGSLAVKKGILSITDSLENVDSTVSLGADSEVIISAKAIGLEKDGQTYYNVDTWELPEGIGEIVNTGGIITVNVVDEGQVKLTDDEYYALRAKIFDQISTEGSTGSVRFGHYERDAFTYDNLSEKLKNWDPVANPDEFSNQVVTDVSGGLYGSFKGVELAEGVDEFTQGDGDLTLSGDKPIRKHDGSVGGIDTGEHEFTTTGDAEMTHVHGKHDDNGNHYGWYKSKGNAKVADVDIGKVDVMAGGSLESDSVKADDMNVKQGASLKTDELSVKTACVDGNANIGTFKEGRMFSDPVIPESGLSFTDASQVSIGTIESSATVEVGQGAIYAIGSGATIADAIAILNSKGYTQFSTSGSKVLKAAAYISGANACLGTLYVTGRTDDEYNADTTKFDEYGASAVIASNSALLIDTVTVGNDPVFQGKVVFESDSVLGLTNVADDCSFVLTNDVVENQGVLLLSDNEFVALDFKNGTLSATVKFDTLAKKVAAMGMQSVAYRALNHLDAVIDTHALQGAPREAGLNLWVDAAGEHYRSNRFGQGSEFKADIGYGTFGADVSVSKLVTLGAAFHYTHGSVKGTVDAVKNTVKGYTGSLYAVVRPTDTFNLIANATYSKTSNDVTSKENSDLRNDTDTTTYALGVRAETAFNWGALSLQPSLGVRYASLKTDAMSVGAIKIGKNRQDLWQVPLSLRLSYQKQTDFGWNVIPEAQVSFAPSFGDDSIKVKTSKQQVLDMLPAQLTLGVQAVKGSALWSIRATGGIGESGAYSYGAGVGFQYHF